MNEFKQEAQNSANAEKTRPISSAITERIVTYVQMYVSPEYNYYFQHVFGLKSRVFIMNADYAVVRDLVILNGTVY